MYEADAIFFYSSLNRPDFHVVKNIIWKNNEIFILVGLGAYVAVDAILGKVPFF